MEEYWKHKLGIEGHFGIHIASVQLSPCKDFELTNELVVPSSGYGSGAASWFPSAFPVDTP